jgi:malate synthase
MQDTTVAVEVRGPARERFDEVLTPEALAFLAALHERFDARRRQLLQARAERRTRIAAGELPDFLDSTADVRAGEWRISPPPPGLADRRVEITGPVDRKMVINALNSGARMFMADFEDANSPTWFNCVSGQVNVMDAIRGTIVHTGENGRVYELKDEIATLLVRPRGLHLHERHAVAGGDEPVSASLFDFGLYVFHNHAALAERGWGPWLYLPKLESHLEARWWNEVFTFAEDELGLERGTIRATVLIETILAAFEMDEILYELRDHAAGLNAGRWDYIFSVIKQLGTDERFVLPDRAQVTMTVPFMRAYADLLVKTCHRRGAHAMGGMAAFIPSRRDQAVNERALAAVTADKQREAAGGFDGTWVAHPDLVPVAMREFDAVLAGSPNQLSRQRDDVTADGAALLDTAIDGGQVTESGLRANVGVGIEYLAWWLCGQGAAAINNLMEDAATAEISRSQVWQWVHHGVRLADGRVVDRPLVERVIEDELAAARERLGSQGYVDWRMDEAARVFRTVALGAGFEEFLTIPAYGLLRD